VALCSAVRVELDVAFNVGELLRVARRQDHDLPGARETSL